MDPICRLTRLESMSTEPTSTASYPAMARYLLVTIRAILALVLIVLLSAAAYDYTVRLAVKRSGSSTSSALQYANAPLESQQKLGFAGVAYSGSENNRYERILKDRSQYSELKKRGETAVESAEISPEAYAAMQEKRAKLLGVLDKPQTIPAPTEYTSSDLKALRWVFMESEIEGSVTKSTK